LFWCFGFRLEPIFNTTPSADSKNDARFDSSLKRLKKKSSRFINLNPWQTLHDTKMTKLFVQEQLGGFVLIRWQLLRWRGGQSKTWRGLKLSWARPTCWSRRIRVGSWSTLVPWRRVGGEFEDFVYPRFWNLHWTA